MNKHIQGILQQARTKRLDLEAQRQDGKAIADSLSMIILAEGYADLEAQVSELEGKLKEVADCYKTQVNRAGQEQRRVHRLEEKYANEKRAMIFQFERADQAEAQLCVAVEALESGLEVLIKTHDSGLRRDEVVRSQIVKTEQVLATLSTSVERGKAKDAVVEAAKALAENFEQKRYGKKSEYLSVTCAEASNPDAECPFKMEEAGAKELVEALANLDRQEDGTNGR